MESSPLILLIHEVAALLRVAPVTVYRWLAERRDGRGHFPLPISERGKRLRWLASDIENFLRQQSQSNVIPPINAQSVRQTTRQDSEFQARQESARRVLEEHRQSRRR